nr:SDR family oxidoreductase [Sporosarcina sp. P13]
MSYGLKGKVVIVTGGSRGIGKAIAKEFLDKEATVVIGSRTKEQVEETVTEFSSIGKIDGFALDISERESVNEFVEKTKQKYGRIDVLVNCAGINTRSPAELFPEEDWMNVMNINLNGAFRMSQEVGKIMIEQKSGNIVNITSILTHTTFSKMGSYAAAKAGLAHYTKILAVEWAQHNIRVNAVSPGYIKTDFTKPGALDIPGYRDSVLAQTPQDRFGTPKEVADSVVFLASDQSTFINGHVLVVDGGFLAGHPQIAAPDGQWKQFQEV